MISGSTGWPTVTANSCVTNIKAFLNWAVAERILDQFQNTGTLRRRLLDQTQIKLNISINLRFGGNQIAFCWESFCRFILV